MQAVRSAAFGVKRYCVPCRSPHSRSRPLARSFGPPQSLGSVRLPRFARSRPSPRLLRQPATAVWAQARTTAELRFRRREEKAARLRRHEVDYPSGLRPQDNQLRVETPNGREDEPLWLSRALRSVQSRWASPPKLSTPRGLRALTRRMLLYVF